MNLAMVAQSAICRVLHCIPQRGGYANSMYVMCISAYGSPRQAGVPMRCAACADNPTQCTT